MKAAIRLPLHFDADALAREATAFTHEEWQAHFNVSTYRGEWSGVALRASGGREALFPDLFSDAPVTDTRLLDRAPAIRAALARFECEIGVVRLLRLAPGAEIREHRDYGLEYAGGEARLHIVLRTNEHVTFLLDGARVPMRAGECWYLDVDRPHAVRNDGETERVHLVIDVRVNPWLHEILTSASEDTAV